MAERKISLKAALKAGNLEAFVAQAEARGAPTGDMAAFDKAITAAVKPPQSARRTSRSPSRDGSGGK